jgi:hypothetical protein
VPSKDPHTLIDYKKLHRKPASDLALPLGVSIAFPFRGHYEVGYQYSAKRREMTSCIIHTLRECSVRNERATLSIAGIPGEVQGNRTVVVRVADGDQFIPYRPQALAQLQKIVEDKEPETLDFEMFFRYSHLKEKKRLFLYSDLYRTRFLIIPGKFQLQIFHVKGIGRTSPNEVAALIERHLITRMRKQGLEPQVEILQEQA